MGNYGRVKLTCNVETVRYYKNGWGIVVASPERIKDGSLKTNEYNYFVLKGQMPQLKEGDMIDVVADYANDPEWGDEYEIQSLFYALTFDDDDKKGQKKFLSSLFTPFQVKNMYEALKDPFSALKNRDYKSLVQIKNCGMKTADLWVRRFHKNYGSIKIFVELSDYDLTNNMVEKLLVTYGNPELVVEKVKNNPYDLCRVSGIGWTRADKIALKGGMSPYDPKRIGGYITYYLYHKAQAGCSWITSDELMGAILDQLGEDVPDAAITKAIHNNESVLWWNEEKTKIGLQRFYRLEQKVAQELIRIRDAPSELADYEWRKRLEGLESAQGWNFSDEQIDGIESVMGNNLSLILGLAGTGKTTMVKALLNIWEGHSFVQCALSGRAASRMAEVTGSEGFTVHRLLGYPRGSKQYGGFFYNQDNVMPYEIYIVDEISMVSIELFYDLIRAIPSGAKLICLGDPGQLESIGSGNLAYDMMRSPYITTVMLTKIHRQAAKSAIITESRKVRSGIQIIKKDWVGEETRGELQDLSLKCYSDSSNTFYETMQAFSRAMHQPGFNIMETQILSPIKKRGTVCTRAINDAVQELWNPYQRTGEEHQVYCKGYSYYLRPGDKIINTVNNYLISPTIYNGNMGIIRGFDYEMDEENEPSPVLIADFWGIGEVVIPKRNWINIELGYAVTVHKFQGSQADHVIFPIDFTSYSLLTRELIYTGITRAKKKIEIIAQTGALRMAVKREGVSSKQTHLQDCLKEICEPSKAKVIF